MTESPSKSNQNLLYALGAVFLVIGGILLFGKFASQPSNATISGSINFNGLQPTSEPNREASIRLMQRLRGETNFEETGVSLPVTDGIAWNWHTAQEGRTYELRADGYWGDTLIKSSNLVLVTAPASGLQLTFNVTAEDLPAGIIPEPTTAPTVSEAPQATPRPQTPSPTPTRAPSAPVSGSVVINGFLPANSFVNFYTRRVGSSELTPFATHVNATNGMTWETDQALAGVSYDFIVRLYTRQGQLIGESNRHTVTAPAANEIVTINSRASEPSLPATVSGSVRLQGQIRQNSSILLLQRVVGEAEFAVIDRLPATREVNWTWDRALSGTTYEITAALQVNEQNVASGNVITVAAPAANLGLVIDTGVNLTTPGQAVSVACGQPDGTNHYNVEISIPQDSTAKLYHLEVGTAAGANNVFDERVRPNSSARIFIPGNAPHFARYRFSACADCNLSDVGNWTGWSPTYGFICENGVARMISE